MGLRTGRGHRFRPALGTRDLAQHRGTPPGGGALPCGYWRRCHGASSATVPRGGVSRAPHLLGLSRVRVSRSGRGDRPDHDQSVRGQAARFLGLRHCQRQAARHGRRETLRRAGQRPAERTVHQDRRPRARSSGLRRRTSSNSTGETGALSTRARPHRGGEPPACMLASTRVTESPPEPYPTEERRHAAAQCHPKRAARARPACSALSSTAGDRTVLPRSQVRDVGRDQRYEREFQYLRQREQSPQGWIRGTSRPRLALLVLLIGVSGQACPIGDILLAEAGTLTGGSKRCREALGIRAPLRFDLFVPPGHLISVVKVARSYGLIRMA